MNTTSVDGAIEPWYAIANVEEIPSPALVVYPARARENIARMIRVAGGTARLRPHVKTHKMSEVVRLQLVAGIDKFKCSTIAEAEMVAAAGGPDVLLAYPQVGPNAARLAALAAAFPAVRFSTIADDAQQIASLSRVFSDAGRSIDVLLDLDTGMHRSGVEPGPAALALYQRIADAPGLRPGGLHVYDGHLRDRDLDARARSVQAAFAPVDTLREQLQAAGMEVPRVVAGGSPSFPIHARRSDVECSPGTCVFWDSNYRAKLPDLEFEYAALLLTRVVSKPGGNRLCLDLGYKAVSPDNPYPRVELLGVPDVELVNHSEEHLAITTPDAGRFAVGDVIYGVPHHVCPTVALHRDAVVVENGRAVARWPVVARDRKLTY
jgi:D-serine deaminase-like pyridoxal phosphate-dependent protein